MAEAAGERRAPALDRVGAQKPADEAEEARCHRGVEDDRAGARSGLLRAEERGGAIGRLAADRLGVEGGRRAAEAEAEAGLAIAAVDGDRLQVGVAGGRLEAAREPGRGGERHPLGL